MTTKARDGKGQPGRGGIGGVDSSHDSSHPAGKSDRAATSGDAHAPAGFDSRPAPPPADGSAHDVEALLAQLSHRLELEASSPGVIPPPGFRADAKGRLVPDRLVRATDELEDATVMRIMAFGVDLADQIARFRRHTYADVAAFLELLGGEYGAPRKGRKGNFTLQSYNGLLKVVVQVQERIVFGPELQIARRIVDECISEWSNGSRDEIVALLQGAFEPDREGRISREAIFRLRKIEIEDPRWRQVRQAIDDAVRVVGTRAYLRLYLRGDIDGPWKAVPIDIAADWRDTGELEEGRT